MHEERVEIHGGEESRHEVLRWRHVQLVLGGEDELPDLHCKDDDSKAYNCPSLVNYFD